MATLTIVDTGYLTSDRDGTAKSGTNIANLGAYICNGGQAITINCPGISLKGGTNMSAEPNPSSNDATKTSFNTFDNEVYEIPFYIDVTNSSERLLLKEIWALNKTVGVKLIYSSDTSTNIKMLPEIIGRTDTRFHGYEVASGLPAFVCRCVGIQINNTSSSRKYAITGSLTFKEEKVVVA